MNTGNQPRVPTMRAVDHVAFTVPDLDQAVHFFVDVLGADLVYTDGPFSDERADGMRQRLDVHPRARCTIAMIRLGEHHNVEFFEYSAPELRTTLPRNSDVGGHHLAFYVDDIDAGYEFVRSIPGVTVQMGPNEVDPSAPVAGQRWFYFQTPWGMQLELTTCSTGGFYDGLPAASMAAPPKRWR
jgi:catechol 2,3-dioxygenase-like lactoylglutathione lyase family enzyme